MCVCLSLLPREKNRETLSAAFADLWQLRINIVYSLKNRQLLQNTSRAQNTLTHETPHCRQCQDETGIRLGCRALAARERSKLTRSPAIVEATKVAMGQLEYTPAVLIPSLIIPPRLSFLMLVFRGDELTRVRSLLGGLDHGGLSPYTLGGPDPSSARNTGGGFNMCAAIGARAAAALSASEAAVPVHPVPSAPVEAPPVWPGRHQRASAGR